MMGQGPSYGFLVAPPRYAHDGSPRKNHLAPCARLMYIELSALERGRKAFPFAEPARGLSIACP